MFGRRIELFRLFGFPVRIDASWLIIAVLITWSLASGLFPAWYPGLSRGMYWTMGLAGALGLFASIVVHEFAHAMVARRYGLPMRGITLFIFGGVAEMGDTPPSAAAEFNVAIAGPIASVAVAALCGVVYVAVSAAAAGAALSGVFSYLGWINLILVAFNVIPAFPLDGGRVLRSALWKWKGNVRWATRLSSEIGSGFGAALIVLGVASILFGAFVGGMWWVLIGLFLRTAAKSSYQQLLVRRALEGEPVRRFMSTDVAAIPPSETLSTAVEDYLYRRHHKMFPVTDNGVVRGCVSAREIKSVPRDQWDQKRIEEVMSTCSSENTIAPGEDAVRALSKMHRTGNSRLMVVDNGSLVGVITLKDLMRFMATKVELEEDGDALGIRAQEMADLR